jgi:hypothetical protein
MSNTTWSNVSIIYPAASGMSIDAQSMILSDVALECTQATWGTAQEKAQRYLAAHLAAMMLKRDHLNSGSISGKTVGDISINYSTPAWNDPSRYDESDFGREYRNMIRGRVVAFRVIQPFGGPYYRQETYNREY